MVKLTMLMLPGVDRRWALARQMGVTEVIAKLAPELTGRAPPYELDALTAAVDRYREGGFAIGGLEGDQFDMRRIKLGLDGRDEDIERYKRMLGNMGQSGIRLLCYNFMPLGWFRNRGHVEARGGAVVTGYRHEPDGGEAEERVRADRLWSNYEYFLRRVLPAAEDAGVRMALHPDDPPAPVIRGIERIFIDASAMDRALAMSDSPSHGLTFCQATYRTMGEDVEALARRYGAAGKVFFVHVRDVRGTWRDFVETFPEDGDTDMAAMFRAYRDIGFDGYMRPDHAPAMAGSTAEADFSGGTGSGYEAEGMIYTMGYMKGLLQATGVGWQ